MLGTKGLRFENFAAVAQDAADAVGVPAGDAADVFTHTLPSRESRRPGSWRMTELPVKWLENDGVTSWVAGE